MFNSIYDNLFSFYLDDFRVWPFIWRTVKMLQKKMPQFLYFFCACEIYLIRNSIMNVSLQISWRRKGMEFENYHGIHLNFSHSSIFISYSVIQVFCPNAKRQSESDCPNNCHENDSRLSGNFLPCCCVSFSFKRENFWIGVTFDIEDNLATQKNQGWYQQSFQIKFKEQSFEYKVV